MGTINGHQNIALDLKNAPIPYLHVRRKGRKGFRELACHCMPAFHCASAAGKGSGGGGGSFFLDLIVALTLNFV